MEEEIKKVIDEIINPLLAKHNGGVVLAGLKDNIASVKMVGACSSCDALIGTMDGVIKKVLLSKIEGLKDVVLSNEIDPEMVELARKIMNGEIEVEYRGFDDK